MSLFKPKEGGGMVDMTVGNSYKHILLFSIPLLLGNLFQQLYNMVDSIVVGNYIGEKALAAVGTGFPIIFMTVSLFMGIGMGATIMVSQYYGAKSFEKVEKTVNTMYTAMMIGSIPLSIFGILIAKPLLRLMNTPDDGTLEMATVYMIVIFVGMIANLGFNVNAGILQGFGDSKSSLLFLLVACVINIILDIVFTVVFGMGVFGVALATIIGQTVSWIYGIWFINKHYTCIKIRPFHFQFDKKLFSQAMKLGIPSGIQQALFSVGIMFMQSLVNSYGSSFMAGFNGANKIDALAFLPIQSFANAVTTYTGQNVGADNYNRVKHGTNATMILAVISCIVVGAILYPLSGTIMKMFNQNPEVIQAGVTYLHSVLPFYVLLAAVFVYTAVMRGAGEMIVPMIVSFVSLWFARIPAAYLLAHYLGRDYMYYSYLIGWIIGAVIAVSYYYTGRWKRKRIVTDPIINEEIELEAENNAKTE